MTTVICAHIPGQGAVLACDSRVTLSTGILSNDFVKYVAGDWGVVALAGTDGAFMRRAKAVQSWEQLEALATECAAAAGANERITYNGIGYDTRARRLKYLDSDGAVVPLRGIVCAGSGGDFAAGFMCALRPSKSLKENAIAARDSVRAAIQRDSASGGRVRVVVCDDRAKSVYEVR